jgi:hypothetical protein
MTQNQKPGVTLTEQQTLMMQKLAQGTGGMGGPNSAQDQKLIYDSLRQQAVNDPDFAKKLDALSEQRVSLRVAGPEDRAKPGTPQISAGSNAYAVKIDPKDLGSGAPVLDMSIKGIIKANAYNAEVIKRGAPLSETDRAELARNEATIQKLEAATVPGAGLTRPAPAPQAQPATPGVTLTEQQTLMMQKLAQGTGGMGGPNSAQDQKLIYDSLRQQAANDPNFAKKLDALSEQRVSLRVAGPEDRAKPGAPQISAGSNAYAIKIDPKDLGSGAPVLDMAIKGVVKANTYNVETIKSSAKGAPLSESDRAEIARNQATIQKLEAATSDSGQTKAAPAPQQSQAQPARTEPLHVAAGLSAGQASSSPETAAPPADGLKLRSPRAETTAGTAARLGAATITAAAVTDAVKSAPGATVSASSALTGDQSAGFRLAGMQTPPVPGRPSFEGLGNLGNLGSLGMAGGAAGGIGEMIAKLMESLMKVIGGSQSMTFAGSSNLVRQINEITGAKPATLTRVGPDGQTVSGPSIDSVDPANTQLAQQQKQQPGVAGPQHTVGMG